MDVINGIATGLGSLLACAGGFTAIGLLGAFVMEPRTRCNPYGVEPCRCDGGDDRIR